MKLVGEYVDQTFISSLSDFFEVPKKEQLHIAYFFKNKIYFCKNVIEYNYVA